MKTLFSRSVLFGMIFFLGVFLLWPLMVTLREALLDPLGQPTLSYLREVFVNPLYREGLLNALWIALATTLGCLSVAMPLAFFYARYRFFGRPVFHGLVLSPLMLPPFVGVMGAQAVLGHHGSLNALLESFGWHQATTDWLTQGRLAGIVVMNVLHLYPILFTQLSNLLLEMDPALEEAAGNLGAGPLRRFFKVLLPLSLPGLFAGASITFIWALTELGVPLLFDFDRVTSVQIFNGIRDLEGNPFPYALVLVLLVLSTLIFLISRVFLRGQVASGGGRAVRSRQLRESGAVARFLIPLFFLLVTLAALAPHLGVLCLAFAEDWYGTVLPRAYTLNHVRSALGNELTLSSISNSLRYAVSSTLIDLVLGSIVAFVLVRSSIRGRALLDGLVMVPLSVPGIVLALGYLTLTREGQPLDWLVREGDPFWLLVMAYAIRRLPYVVRAVCAGLQQLSVTYEEAALNLGAGPLRTSVRITLPLIAPALMTGGLLAFAFAMLDVSDSMLLAQRTAHFPITKAIYTLSGTLGEGPALAAALGVWSMIFLVTLLLGLAMIAGIRTRRDAGESGS